MLDWKFMVEAPMLALVVGKLLQPGVALPQLRAIAPYSARQVSAVANEGTSHDPGGAPSLDQQQVWLNS